MPETITIGTVTTVPIEYIAYDGDSMYDYPLIHIWLISVDETSISGVVRWDSGVTSNRELNLKASGVVLDTATQGTGAYYNFTAENLSEGTEYQVEVKGQHVMYGSGSAVITFTTLSEPSGTSNITVNNQPLKNAFVGSSSVAKIFVGNTLVYDKSAEEQGLTISVLACASAVKLNYNGQGAQLYDPDEVHVFENVESLVVIDQTDYISTIYGGSADVNTGCGDGDFLGDLGFNEEFDLVEAGFTEYNIFNGLD